MQGKQPFSFRFQFHFHDTAVTLRPPRTSKIIKGTEPVMTKLSTVLSLSVTIKQSLTIVGGFAKHIIMGCLFRNIHLSLQYSFHSLIHTSWYDLFHMYFWHCASSPWYDTNVDLFSGLGPDFVKWVSVLRLMADAKSCVAYCSWLSEYFAVEAGIHQGCPFSPLAFFLAVELLAIKIWHCENIKALNYWKARNSLLPTI